MPSVTAEVTAPASLFYQNNFIVHCVHRLVMSSGPLVDHSITGPGCLSVNPYKLPWIYLEIPSDLGGGWGRGCSSPWITQWGIATGKIPNSKDCWTRNYLNNSKSSG